MLISFMGGLNHPDLATRAGEETLPQYDDSDLEHDDGELPTEESNYLVPIAKNAVDLAESNNGQSGEVNGTAMRPTRPKIDTHTIAPDANDPSRPVTTDLHHDASTLPLCDTSISATSVSRSSRSPPRSVPPGKASIEPPAISPLLRKYTIPSSERAPTETLPAMQNSPPASSSKSPNGVQKLPSLSQIQLEPAKLDARSPNEHHHGINRSPYPMNNGTVASPPIGSIAPRPGRYPSPRAPVMSNGAFPTYQYGQPSPATSDASPRDSNMSPPNKPPVQAFYSNRQTPRSEELTPQSAHSQESASSFSTAPSPQQMDRPILPPLAGLPNGPMMTGSFKCDHAGCAAAPFQTQYLLKYVFPRRELYNQTTDLDLKLSCQCSLSGSAPLLPCARMQSW